MHLGANKNLEKKELPVFWKLHAINIPFDNTNFHWNKTYSLEIILKVYTDAHWYYL